MQEKLVAYSSEQSIETEQAFQVFVRSIAETEEAVKVLKASEAQITQVYESFEILQSAAAHFRTSSNYTEPAQNVLITQNTSSEGEIEIYAVEPALEFAD